MEKRSDNSGIERFVNDTIKKSPFTELTLDNYADFIETILDAYLEYHYSQFKVDYGIDDEHNTFLPSQEYFHAFYKASVYPQWGLQAAEDYDQKIYDTTDKRFTNTFVSKLKKFEQELDDYIENHSYPENVSDNDIDDYFEAFIRTRSSVKYASDISSGHPIYIYKRREDDKPYPLKDRQKAFAKRLQNIAQNHRTISEDSIYLFLILGVLVCLDDALISVNILDIHPRETLEQTRYPTPIYKSDLSKELFSCVNIYLRFVEDANFLKIRSSRRGSLIAISEFLQFFDFFFSDVNRFMYQMYCNHSLTLINEAYDSENREILLPVNHQLHIALHDRFSTNHIPFYTGDGKKESKKKKFQDVFTKHLYKGKPVPILNPDNLPDNIDGIDPLMDHSLIDIYRATFLCAGTNYCFAKEDGDNPFKFLVSDGIDIIYVFETINDFFQTLLLENDQYKRIMDFGISNPKIYKYVHQILATNKKVLEKSPDEREKYCLSKKKDFSKMLQKESEQVSEVLVFEYACYEYVNNSIALWENNSRSASEGNNLLNYELPSLSDFILFLVNTGVRMPSEIKVDPVLSKDKALSFEKKDDDILFRIIDENDIFETVSTILVNSLQKYEEFKEQFNVDFPKLLFNIISTDMTAIYTTALESADPLQGFPEILIFDWVNDDSPIFRTESENGCHFIYMQKNAIEKMTESLKHELKNPSEITATMIDDMYSHNLNDIEYASLVKSELIICKALGMACPPLLFSEQADEIEVVFNTDIMIQSYPEFDYINYIYPLAYQLRYMCDSEDFPDCDEIEAEAFARKLYFNLIEKEPEIQGALTFKCDLSISHEELQKMNHYIETIDFDQNMINDLKKVFFGS